MKTISIVVPVWNEEKNIIPLVKEIHSALSPRHITYEVIMIDDHSTDSSYKKMQALAKEYPVKSYKKQGKKGKAQSLLEGFSYARYNTICMIDADLQYPPAIIPEMLAKLSKHDIVVAHRHEYQAGKLRRVLSSVFNLMFGKLLHGLDTDVQSGLKVFKKEIVERLALSPSQWSFDLEFLIKARTAGYSVTSVPITFAKRKHGNSHVSVLSTAIDLAKSALYLKLTSPKVIPFHPRQNKQQGQGFHFNGKPFVSHTELSLHETALYNLTAIQKILVLLLGVSCAVLFFWQGMGLLVAFFSVLTIVYFADLLFNLYLIYNSFFKEQEIEIRKKELLSVTEWPRYTIFCPLYKEWEVVPQFISAMSQLDYPKDKLEVMILLEEDDVETQQKISHMNLPAYFQVRVIPHAHPKTKPKALNYGLKYATGEYVVIYDAEDIPDTDQLKKAVVAFTKRGKKTMCIQAKLNFYNPEQNLLTRMFTAEYSLWFDLVLTGLQSIYAPIPLGGTSNHFRIGDIRQLSGWDPFNVTEDADLGMRLAKRGYLTAIMNSTTKEEANSNVKNWLRQRSRWIKGYIQTYFVHMRRPQEFMQNWKNPRLLTFQLVIGGKILSLLINPVMWVMTIGYFTLTPYVGSIIESFFPGPIFYIAVFSLFIGNFLYVYYYMLGCTKRQQFELIPFMLLIPLYWLLMSIAAVWALWEYIVRPHYWQKTQHGLHLRAASPPEKRWFRTGKAKEELVFASA